MQPELTDRKCGPCEGGVCSLKGEALSVLHQKLESEWKVVNEHQLEREYSFPDFRTALEFTKRVGELAEAEGHHPDIHLGWGRVRLVLWTHHLDGLSENDFILAAKVDQIR